MTTKHTPATPLPWRVSPARPAEVQQQSGTYSIGLMGMDGAANAAYIAHAANAYPRLVDALRGLIALDVVLGREFYDRQTVADARALLRELGEPSAR